MDVPFIDYTRGYRAIKSEIDKALLGCLDRGDLICRRDLIEFEKKFANYCQVDYGVGVGNCCDALFLVMKAAGIGPGYEVITVAHTYIGTIAAIKACGATPVLVDVEYDSMNMDVEKASNAMTNKTRAVIPVHLNGRMCDMGALIDLHQYIIEDAAQAVGAMWNEQFIHMVKVKAGSWGLAGCFSFYPAKILGWYGDGGMITTDSDLLYDKLLHLRVNGESAGYGYVKDKLLSYAPKSNNIYCWGYNSRLDNIAAAVLDVKMNYLEENIQRRRDIARKYHSVLWDLEEVNVPIPPDNDGEPENFDVYQNYVIKVPEKRDALERLLREKGIETMVHWRIPNHKQKYLGLDHYDLPVTEKLSREVLSLPMYPELTDDEVYYVAENIRAFFK